MNVAILIFLILCFLGLATLNDHARAIRKALEDQKVDSQAVRKMLQQKWY